MRRMWVVVCLLVCAGTVALGAQERAEGVRRGGRIDSDVSAEERVIRNAYAKLSAFNKAHYVGELFGDQEWVADQLAMQFELRDFHTGDIAEILPQSWNSLVTPPDGDIIRGDRITSRVGTEERYSYPARWEPGYWSTIDDDRWSVAEAFTLEPHAFVGIGKYTSYEVTVRFEGRSRTYRAMAIYRTLSDPVNELKPEFVDNVVGLAGDVTIASRQSLRPLDARSAAVGGHGRITRGDGIATNLAGSFSTEYWNAYDATDHRDGNHGTTFMFTKTCTDTAALRQACRIAVSSGAGANCTGNRTVLSKHVGALSVQPDSQEGAKTTDVKCGAAAGIAFIRCLVSCSLSITVSAEGKGVGAVEAKWVSHDSSAFFSGKHGVGLTCPAQTDGEDDGEGDGCAGQQSVPAGTGGETSDPTIKPTYSISGMSGTSGGSGTQLTNACDTTPVILDVAGDGYAMTGAADGVRFDLDNDGVEEQLSWTAAGTDDAFLVADRNGNGAIDNGNELFGNYTIQPASSERNGFLALAVYDLAEQGGNADGVIDARDTVYPFLRLWRDADHDGDSQPSELSSLAANGVERLHLSYKESKRTDAHGNAFRYRAKVDGSNVARWAWDVFLVEQ